MIGESVLTLPDERKDSDEQFLYGVIDGAQRFWALIQLILDPASPEYTIHFLVPCQVMKNTIPEELVIAIATREFIFDNCPYF